MVAWHEMPGSARSRIRPGGYGMIWLRGPFDYLSGERNLGFQSHRSLRDGSCLPVSQAFHVRLPSFGPSGTDLSLGKWLFDNVLTILFRLWV